MQESRPPTDAECRYLRAVASLIEKGKEPTIGAVAKKAKRKRTAARQGLGRLERLGLVRLTEFHAGCSRRIELVNS